MRYFATFTDTGERINTYVADGMPLTVADIIKQYPTAIEISEADQLLYMQGYVRGNDGKPKQVSAKADDLSTTKQNKIKIIQTLATAKLAETDRTVLEYFELKNMTEEQFESLKEQRQKIRDYRDKLISLVNESDDVNVINNVQFLL